MLNIVNSRYEERGDWEERKGRSGREDTRLKV